MLGVMDDFPYADPAMFQSHFQRPRGLGVRCVLTVPGGADDYAWEGLHDCEPLVQQAACAVVPDVAWVPVRRGDLGDDPLSPEIREAVRQCLTELTGWGSAR